MSAANSAKKKMKMPYVLGIDIGGTKISVTLGHRKGKLLHKILFSSYGGREPKRSLKDISGAIHAIFQKFQITKNEVLGIGVGVPGPMDPTVGIVQCSPNLKKWESIPLKLFLKKKFQVPVAMENDANAAALGEKYFGVGRNSDNFIYITVSTGIGSGIVANGKLIRGSGGAAGELGHITIVPKGRRCGCGKRGCLEAYASGSAIAHYVRTELLRGRRSRFFKEIKVHEVTGVLVAEAAMSGDSLAIEAREVAADYLGIGIANIINLLNPEKIILGGGVMSNRRFLWKPMLHAVRRESWRFNRLGCSIIPSALGGDVADLGTYAVVLNMMETSS